MFYTYIHYTADTLRPFYIGKGSRNRSTSNNGRNKYWKNIVNKHGYTSEIIAEFYDENEAFQHEIFLISTFRSLGYSLTNISDGGEGATGFKTDAHKKSISEYSKNRAPEHQKKINDSLRGKKIIATKKRIISEETRKIRAAQCRKNAEARKGTKLTSEHIEKVSSKLKGRKRNLSPETVSRMTRAGLEAISKLRLQRYSKGK